MVRSFLDKSIGIKAMKSVDYVIELTDSGGGSGTNYLVVLSSKSTTVKPDIQVITIGNDANKSFAFLTDDYSISRN